jgi:hypothetical protein
MISRSKPADAGGLHERRDVARIQFDETSPDLVPMLIADKGSDQIGAAPGTEADDPNRFARLSGQRCPDEPLNHG